MKELPEGLETYLLNRYKNSSYANFLQMHILELQKGETVISILVRPELTNLSRILHGGVVGSLLNMAMNLSCFSLGCKVAILSFNINYIGACKVGTNVRAVTRILHGGRRTMVAEGQILDSDDRLLAKGRGTFLVTGHFTDEDLQGKGIDGPVTPEGMPEGEKSYSLPTETKSMNGWLRDLLLHVHEQNHFAKFLGMDILDLSERHCIVSMLVTPRHLNIRGVVHGGALVSLADMSMMLACATLGKHTVTLDLNINFIRRGREGEVVSSFAQVIHKGKSIMVARSSIQDKERRLLTEARGTFFITGDYTPDEWDMGRNHD